MAFHVLYGAEGAAGDSKAKLAVVKKVSMSVGMVELLVREEMKTESNSHHLQRRRPVQLKVNGLFIQATLSSIRPTQMGLSLNIGMSSMAFIEPLLVIDFVAQILGKDVLSKLLSNADRIKIKKALRGVKVEVTHRGSFRRKYRISGLTLQPTRELNFPLDEKMNMKSVVDYFQEMYGYTIKYSHLPCLQVGSQKKACKIVSGQRYTKGLNEKQITSLLKVSCQRPCERETDILQTIQQNDYEYSPYAKEFGINIDNKLALVEARVLPAPWVNKSLCFYRCVICFADYCASYLNMATIFIFLALICV